MNTLARLRVDRDEGNVRARETGVMSTITADQTEIDRDVMSTPAEGGASVPQILSGRNTRSSAGAPGRVITVGGMRGTMFRHGFAFLGG